MTGCQLEPVLRIRYQIQGLVLILNGDSEAIVSFLPTGRVLEGEEAISKTRPGALELSGRPSSIRLHLEFQNMSSVGKVSVFAGLLVKELLVTIPNLRLPVGLVTVFCKTRRGCSQTENLHGDEGRGLGEATACQERPCMEDLEEAGRSCLVLWTPKI